MLAELLFGRLAVVVGRLLVPVVGRLLAVGLEVMVGRTAVPLLLGRPEALPAVAVLPETVGRVVDPLIEPALVRPETVAPFCGVRPLILLPPLIEPAVPPCLTLAT